MTSCECPLAGYCQRHQVKKANGWHKLCQTKQAYFDAWENGTGPGQVRKPDETRELRRKKVEEATKRKARLIEWLRLFRLESEKGLGDTSDRLVKQKKKSPPWVPGDAHDAIRCLLKQCSCSRQDAVARLNEQYPR